MQRKRVEAGPRSLGALGIGTAAFGDDRVSLEGRARLVVPTSSLELVDGLVKGSAIARQADLQQRLERPHDGDQITRTEVLVDEAMQRGSYYRGVRRADEILVEVDSNHARVVARRLRTLVGRRSNAHNLSAIALSRCSK